MGECLGFIYNGVIYPPDPKQIPEEAINKLRELVEKDFKAKSENAG